MSSQAVTLYKESRGLQVRNSQVNLSGANNLFGSIATGRLGLGTQFDFIPTDSNGGIMSMFDTDNIKAQWLGLTTPNMQFWAYNFCSPLAGVIDRLAEAGSNGIIKFQNEDGTTVKNPNKSPSLARIKSLLLNPNPEQTWDEFDTEQDVIAKIFGYCPVWGIGPFGMDKSHCSAMVNLNPFYWRPTYNYDYDLKATKGDPNRNKIKTWMGTVLGTTYNIPATDILLIKDGFIDSSNQFGLPMSKIAGLDYFISNICAAMEADNVLLKKKGPLGVFSYDARPDMAGWSPMTPKAKDEIQNDLKQYGMTWGQLQYVISKQPIKWNAMSFNVQELMTKETVRQGIEGICDRLGFPAELMSGKNATYENRNSAEKFLYQNNIIPFSLRKMARYNSYFELNSGPSLIQDYDYLPVLQDDIVKAGQAFEALSNGISELWTGGLLTFNQCQLRLDEDAVTGMDIYYNEYLKKYPPPKQLAKPKKSANAPAS